ncbi:DUF1800 domain-containing protein [Chitinophaga tropicalis]|uniref:DUF1800 family protein n=1 Tax=Chitinophaga tropicalis TaxID=2683588 RepID=A0A7K1UBV9_9BACT|nr:DUF1800 domain-containing protein [Chitinophaga tropicalis]MVT11877.1 DUF1800 family protein [Chitinophaga tropicalis]
MDRRQFLTLPSRRQQTVKADASIATGRTDSGLAPYTGEFGTAQVVHLLKRTMFGATPEDITWCKGLTMDAAVEALINTTNTVTTQPLNTYGDDATGIAPGATWVNSAPPPEDGDLDRNRWPSYKAWWMDVMINQGRSIQEKMVLFWHNHFPTELTMVNDARYIYKYNTMLRANATGNFKTLTKAVTLDPAMLKYLNGYLNGKESPDENYGRELHELFTVGKGPDSHYTEEDVRATAQVLTGFRIEPVSMTSYFESTQHVITNKEFSSFYNNRKIAGKSGAEGATELDDLLDIIFEQHEVSKFICRKIYRFFVYYQIDAAVEQNVITPLAQIFRDNLYDIKPVLKALFKSEHFFDPLNMSALIKSPVDFTVGLCREFGVEFPTDYMSRFESLDRLREHTGRMLQDIGDPPLVAGWEAYRQEPQYHEMWINTDTLPKRNMMSDSMISSGGFGGVKIDVLAFADKLSEPGNPVVLIQDSLDLLYRMPLSDNSKARLKNLILLSGQSPDSDYYWTEAWDKWKTNPTSANRNTVESRLQTLYKYLMNMSEYQLS